MGTFYKPSSYKGFEKFFKKFKFDIRQGGGHLIATHPNDPEIELSVPRHTTLSNGLTEKECKKLIELGFNEKDIKKYILK